MALFTWWRGDALPELAKLDGFRAAAVDNAHLLAALAGLRPSEAQRRLASHHRPYVAFLGTLPVAYGWVALEGADIGELGVEFVLPAGDCYLWDFKTLPAWRGRGIYSRLLQIVVRVEERTVERFWIIHAPENGASQSGIKKAGFRLAGELSFRRGGGVALVPGDRSGRARVGAAVLGVPLVEKAMIPSAKEEPLAPCWRCVIDARQNGAEEATVACWVPSSNLLAASYHCACGSG